MLTRHHVEAAIADAILALGSVPSGNGYEGSFTLRILYATIGIDEGCFCCFGMNRVSRILVQPDPEPIVSRPTPTAATLGALVRRIGAYEPDLVKIIHQFGGHRADKLYRVCDFGFLKCSGLSEVTLPDTLIHIGDSAFDGCTGLRVVTLPKSLKSIGSSAFNACTALVNVSLPNSLAFIGSYAFFGCTGLAEVTLPASVLHIGRSSFGGCTALTTVTLLNSHTRIGDHAFACAVFDNGPLIVRPN